MGFVVIGERKQTNKKKWPQFYIRIKTEQNWEWIISSLIRRNLQITQLESTLNVPKLTTNILGILFCGLLVKKPIPILM